MMLTGSRVVPATRPALDWRRIAHGPRAPDRAVTVV